MVQGCTKKRRQKNRHRKWNLSGHFEFPEMRFFLFRENGLSDRNDFGAIRKRIKNNYDLRRPIFKFCFYFLSNRQNIFRKKISIDIQRAICRDLDLWRPWPFEGQRSLTSVIHWCFDISHWRPTSGKIRTPKWAYSASLFYSL